MFGPMRNSTPDEREAYEKMLDRMSTTIGVNVMNLADEDARSKFERQTKNGLEECGRWLTEHAGELARSFSGGCQGWSVEFADGVEGCPEIRVRVNEVDKGVMDAYFFDKGVIDAYFCGREEG